MPHSGGGGSHSGGSHSSHSSHRSGNSSSSYRKSNTYFSGARTYVVYRRGQEPSLVYTNNPNYSEEVTKSQTVASCLFAGFFALIGIGEFIAIICIIASSFYTGIRKTNISNIDSSIYIEDRYDIVSEQSEKQLKKELEKFRDDTGIVPSIVFTKDDAWSRNYTSMESYAYDVYIKNFDDEKHLVITYSIGYNDEVTGFTEFNWWSMWGDDLGRTAKESDEDAFRTIMQRKLSRDNGEDPAGAIGLAFAEFKTSLDKHGFFFGEGSLIAILFVIVHGSIFGVIGFAIIISSIKKYKKSKNGDVHTYKINGEPEIKKCEYCGVTYYAGTIGTCNSCGAPLS